jgi:hypothetical protein
MIKFGPIDLTVDSLKRGAASLHVTSVMAVVVLLSACGGEPPQNDARPASAPPAASVPASDILARYRALDDSRDSRVKVRARIQGSDGAPPEVQMNIYRKRETDGRRLMLVEFTSPAEERDRDGLVTISPQGEIEGTRYLQSNDSFVSAQGVMGEDSLFGMTLQELADGQPEKYDFKLAGEETVGSTPVYRLEGTLKPSAESKFSKLALLISKENFAALVAEFYDNQNELMRRMTVDQAEQVAGRWTRKRWTVENIARKKKIDFEALDVKYDQNLDGSIFTREHLKKIASK